MMKFGKFLIVVASSTVIIPYSIAFIAYALYGKNSDISRKWTNIINPRKIIAINYAMFKQIKKLKFLKLYFQMISFYKKAPKEKLIKNIAYGANSNFLDVYVPENGFSKQEKLPVVVFIYGGTWSSGDKNMYGLLCSNISKILSCVVVCPNYTLYPKGFVDDMVQDVSDALVWIYSNISMYGGDKNRIGMIGHSAGGHLCALTLLELAMKNKITNFMDTKLMSSPLNVSTVKQSKLELKDNHFNGDNNQVESINNVESSFIMVPSQLDDGSSICIIDNTNNGSDNKVSSQDDEKLLHDDNLASLQDDTTLSIINADENSSIKNYIFEGKDNISFPDAEESIVAITRLLKSKVTDGGSIVQSDVKSILKSEFEKDENIHNEEDMLFEKILPSVKLFIGLAGVYDIVDHFAFETLMGVEDISMMARAMYDEQHFPLFSPVRLIQCLSNVNVYVIVF